MSQAIETMNNDPRVIVKNLKESIVEGLPFLALLMKRLMVAINKLPHLVQIAIAPIAEQAQAKTAEMILQYESALLQNETLGCLLYTSPSPRDGLLSRMPSSA